MAHVIVVGILCLLVVSVFIRQIIEQLRSGKMRPRGSETCKTRQENPVWYWSSIGLQIILVLMVFYLFAVTVLKASI